MQLRRAAEKEAKGNQATEDWILALLVKLSLKIPDKSEQIKSRKKANANCQAKRRANESAQERRIRLDKEAIAQKIKRALENEEEHEARLDRESKHQIAKYNNPDVPDEYFEQKLTLQRSRQQKLRDSWTVEQREAYNHKKNEYQKQNRLDESKEDQDDRLQIDRDSKWLKRREDQKIISNYEARLLKAKQDRNKTFGWQPPIHSVEFLNDAEKKVFEDRLTRRKADTERRNARKTEMSKDELQIVLDKNSKWHLCHLFFIILTILYDMPIYYIFSSTKNLTRSYHNATKDIQVICRKTSCQC